MTTKKLDAKLKLVRDRLKDTLDEDLSYAASAASRSLEEIRSHFYGTELEGELSEMIALCDEISQLTEV